jgi:hypothetical protein
MHLLFSLILGTSLAGAGAGEFDHGYSSLAQFYGQAIAVQGVDYADLATRRTQLDDAVAAMASADLTGFGEAQQLALYINAYNAYTIRLVLDNQPLKSIMDLDGGKVWDARKFVVANGSLTLNQIEHEHVRRLGDARVHAAVNCAARGCPPLSSTPFTADAIEAQLTAASGAWAAHNAYRIEGQMLWLSSLFDWYGDDFSTRGDLPDVDGKSEAALWFIGDHVPAAQRARLHGGGLTAAWQPYDWSLNGR